MDLLFRSILVQEGVEKLLGVGDGHLFRQNSLKSGAAGDVADSQHAVALGGFDEGGEGGLADVRVDLDGVVALLGVLIDQLLGGFWGVAFEDGWSDGVDGGAEEFAFGDLVAPPEVAGATVEVVDG